MVVTATTLPPEADVKASLGWGGCMYDGEGVPKLYWGARTIFHGPTLEYEKCGLNRNRLTGKVVQSNPYKYRTIRTKGHLEFLYDRKGWGGALYRTDCDDAWFQQFIALPEVKAMIEWLGTNDEGMAMPALNRWVQRCGQDETFELADGPYRMRASCRNSGGYCYIAAWQIAP